MLTVYTKDECPYCDRAKKYLENGDIEFSVINVVEDAQALAFIKENNHRTVPQIYLDGELFVDGGCDGLMNMTHDMIKIKLEEMDLSNLSL
jgi:glutaredoxin